MPGILGQTLSRRALSLVANNPTYAPVDLVLRLYTNSWTPAPADTLSDYTECIASGYAPINIPGTAWADSAIINGGQIAIPNQTFNITSAVTLFGYYFTDPSNTYFMAAEEFSAPIVIGSGGGIFLLSVVLEIITC